ncbi:AbrB/MazE/SpoVT family DNA-binding domain-containing protein [soil metagenome]
MPTATVTSKGQVTIPLEVRERLGIGTGTRVQFLAHPDGTWEFAATGGTVTSIRGMFSATGHPVTVEDMNEAIADAAADRYLQT